MKKFSKKITFVSGMTTYVQLRKIIKLRINNYVNYLVISEEARSEKLYSIMFLFGLKKTNCLPSEAIMVGQEE
jgi:putative hydrolase of the HAD superfamily